MYRPINDPWPLIFVGGSGLKTVRNEHVCPNWLKTHSTIIIIMGKFLPREESDDEGDCRESADCHGDCLIPTFLIVIIIIISIIIIIIIILIIIVIIIIIIIMKNLAVGGLYQSNYFSYLCLLVPTHLL